MAQGEVAMVLFVMHKIYSLGLSKKHCIFWRNINTKLLQ